MNTSQIGSTGALALDLGRPTAPRFIQQTAEDGSVRPMVVQGDLSEEDKGYRATCEESYRITNHMLALYAMYPDALYEI